MYRLFFLIALLFTPGIPEAQQVSLNLARETYFGMSANECNALKLSAEFDKNPPKEAVLKAYHGASTAASPTCLGNPAKKISYFSRGKQLIAEAVMMQPNNFEIRFLRFATQSKTPSFLGYNQHIEEDKKFLLANLNKGRETISNNRIYNMILDFLASSDRLSKTEQSGVKRLNITTEK